MTENYPLISLSTEKVTNILNKVTKLNYQNIIVVTGRTGVGKSTLALKLGLKGDNSFVLEKNVLYNPTFREVMRTVIKLPYYSYIILDEAIKVAYNKEWWSETSRLMDKFFNLCRKERKTIIFCIPNFNDLTRAFREMCNLWIHVLERGKAILLTKDPLFMGRTSWDLDKMYKKFSKNLKGKRYYDIATSDLTYLLRRSPHYVGEFKFDKLDSKFEARYEMLRDKEKYNDLDVSHTDNKLAENIKIYRYALNKIGLTEKEIAEFTDVTRQTINYSIKTLDDEQKAKVNSIVSNIYNNRSKNNKISHNKGDLPKTTILGSNNKGGGG